MKILKAFLPAVFIVLRIALVNRISRLTSKTLRGILSLSKECQKTVRSHSTGADTFLISSVSHGNQGGRWVGDAGYHRDPALGLGMAEAFRDSGPLAEAVVAGLGEPCQFGISLFGRIFFTFPKNILRVLQIETIEVNQMFPKVDVEVA